jgi:hypothetical protein
MTVLITLTIAGSDTGPFDLYSDVDGFVVPFENNVPKASLVSGYTSSLVPNGTIVIRVKSDSVCTNYIDLIVGGTTTTTTSTSTSTSTSTTTTTTTLAPTCSCFRADNVSGEERTVTYTKCLGSVPSEVPVATGVPITDCYLISGGISFSGSGVVITSCPEIPCTSEGDCGTCGAP